MQFIINAKLTGDKKLIFTNSVPQSQGEHLATQINIEIPIVFSDNIFFLEFMCPHNKRYISKQLVCSSSDSQFLHYTYLVPNCIVAEQGLVLVQLVARSTVNNTVVIRSQKSQQSAFYVTQSILAEQTEFAIDDYFSEIIAKTNQAQQMVENAQKSVVSTIADTKEKVETLISETNTDVDKLVSATNQKTNLLISNTNTAVDDLISQANNKLDTVIDTANTKVDSMLEATNQKTILLIGDAENMFGELSVKIQNEFNDFLDVSTTSVAELIVDTNNKTEDIAQNLLTRANNGEFNGAKGDKGLQGIQGLRGETGQQGERGLQGIQGNQGVKGDIGPSGAVGAKGDTGAKGEKGDKGDKGDMSSMYQHYIVLRYIYGDDITCIFNIVTPSATPFPDCESVHAYFVANNLVGKTKLINVSGRAVAYNKNIYAMNIDGEDEFNFITETSNIAYFCDELTVQDSVVKIS